MVKHRMWLGWTSLYHSPTWSDNAWNPSLWSSSSPPPSSPSMRSDSPAISMCCDFVEPFSLVGNWGHSKKGMALHHPLQQVLQGAHTERVLLEGPPGQISRWKWLILWSLQSVPSLFGNAWNNPDSLRSSMNSCLRRDSTPSLCDRHDPWEKHFLCVLWTLKHVPTGNAEVHQPKS